MTDSDQATQCLAELGQGDSSAADRLFPLIYRELRALAGSLFRAQRNNHTLQPTALVHEVFIRLIDQSAPAYQNRGHFMAVAAKAMHQILIDHARGLRAQKRGGDRDRVGLDAVTIGIDGEQDAIELIALDDALTRLSTLDPRKHKIVELRFFGGLTMEETAEVVGFSKPTVELEWRAARAWLNSELSR